MDWVIALETALLSMEVEEQKKILRDLFGENDESIKISTPSEKDNES